MTISLPLIIFFSIHSRNIGNKEEEKLNKIKYSAFQGDQLFLCQRWTVVVVRVQKQRLR